MYQENTNLPYIPEKQPNMMPYAPMPESKSLTEETRKYRAMYPEIHYRLEPFISTTCDKIESSGVMPSQQELDDITDDIYDDFCAMYPDMADYMGANDRKDSMPEAVPAQVIIGGRPGRYNPYRRRNLGRDLISSLLLSRIFGRRPYNPYYRPYPYPYY